MSKQQEPKVKKVIITQLTVAQKETVKPGTILTLDASEANILINANKAKVYEPGDEKKYRYESKRAGKKNAEKEPSKDADGDKK